MRHKKVNEKFQKYMDSLATPSAFRHYSNHVATIFGRDLVEIDENAGRIKLPELGWQPLSPMPKAKQVSWVALFKGDRGFEIAFGFKGMSPYSSDAAEFLPVIDGIILAMPYMDAEKLKNKMIAT